MPNIITILNNLNIPFEEEGKNIGKDWVGVNCPYCSDFSNHGGFNREDGHYNCWMCGGHPLDQTLSKISGLPLRQVRKELKEIHPLFIKKQKKELSRPNELSLPLGCGPLQEQHIKYILKRNFDPDVIIREYGIMGCGPIGPYKYRIIIPIYYQEQLISYQGRSITDKTRMRYKACIKAKEVIPYKSILYDMDKSMDSSVVVVEGITDAWRLGHGSVATFGISYTQAQVNLLSKYHTVHILFDSEPGAQRLAHTLAEQLSVLGVSAYVHTIEGYKDPGSLPQKEADYIMKQLLGKR